MDRLLYYSTNRLSPHITFQEALIKGLAPDLIIMRLDGGPTASFKDFAARLMARLIKLLLMTGTWNP